MAKIDLDAVAEEAAGDAHTVVWKGETYEVPRISEWPVEAIDALERGQLASVFRLVLPADRWREFAKGRPKVKHFEAMMAGIEDAEGLAGGDDEGGGPGNSQGSARSSRSTPARSSRTSRGTTKSSSRTSTPVG